MEAALDRIGLQITTSTLPLSISDSGAYIVGYISMHARAPGVKLRGGPQGADARRRNVCSFVYFSHSDIQYAHKGLYLHQRILKGSARLV